MNDLKEMIKGLLHKVNLPLLIFNCSKVMCTAYVISTSLNKNIQQSSSFILLYKIFHHNEINSTEGFARLFLDISIYNLFK